MIELLGLICGFIFLASIAGFIFLAFSGQIIAAAVCLIVGFVVLFIPTAIDESL